MKENILKFANFINDNLIKNISESEDGEAMFFLYIEESCRLTVDEYKIYLEEFKPLFKINIRFPKEDASDKYHFSNVLITTPNVNLDVIIYLIHVLESKYGNTDVIDCSELNMEIKKIRNKLKSITIGSNELTTLH